MVPNVHFSRYKPSKDGNVSVIYTGGVFDYFLFAEYSVLMDVTGLTIIISNINVRQTLAGTVDVTGYVVCPLSLDFQC